MKEINETKNQFFEKIHKTDKPLAMITKDKRKNAQVTKITNEGRVIMNGLTCQVGNGKKEPMQQPGWSLLIDKLLWMGGWGHFQTMLYFSRVSISKWMHEKGRKWINQNPLGKCSNCKAVTLS